jgi:hypothetical protein
MPTRILCLRRDHKMAKGKGKHQPPSKIKYDQEHPTVTCRVDKDVHEALLAIKAKTGASMADVLKMGLGRLEPKATNEEAARKEAYAAGYKKGHDEAFGRYAVSYRCCVCGESMWIDTTAGKEAVCGYMQEHHWGHRKCHAGAPAASVAAFLATVKTIEFHYGK